MVVLFGEFLCRLNSISFLRFGFRSCFLEAFEDYFGKWVITSDMSFDIEQIELMDDLFGTDPYLEEFTEFMETKLKLSSLKSFVEFTSLSWF